MSSAPAALPLAALPLSRHAVDRDHTARSRPALFDELWAEPGTRVLALWQGRALLTPESVPAATPPGDGWSVPDAGTAAVALLPVERVPAALLRVYLGRTLVSTSSEPAGTPVVLEVLTNAAARELEPDEARWGSLRTVATALGDRDAGLFTEALAIASWHASHTHCPRCGTPTVVEQDGWVRRCSEDRSEIFPRTDPAVIVTVLDADDRLLLGSNALWEHSRYSLLAGFVEPGESFEAAVEREIFEEAGVRVVDARYKGSQPWPFPASIMVGMTARLADDQPAAALEPDGEEILSLRWFSRSQLWESRERVILPGRSSIARALIEDWYGGPLDEPPVRP
ncbi:NADH pyrophosphatase [Leifsonia xyli subsp. cynodontis DSM 46306]|uniref:NAD(+) diphosphatase n=1 Tax=Leifsonia xyli subsp. cynodontis DSM 46306 TaxID=1389489 RepID=U3P3Y8_LEIXC|nr:NAD(+) diphosphatase [Leifsonia xyli]AGW41025.1 NADH pyrophosphatase [Leifsonia xyli subsp. cynodontis DSM 46306]